MEPGGVPKQWAHIAIYQPPVVTQEKHKTLIGAPTMTVSAWFGFSTPLLYEGQFANELG